MTPLTFTTSKTDSQLLLQKVHQIISVTKTNTGVFVVFNTERELKYQFSGRVFVFISEILWQTFLHKNWWMKNASREMISADVFSDLKVFSSSFLVLQERIWPCNVKMKRRRQFLFSSRPIWGKRWGRVHWHQRFISYPSVFSSFTNRDDITISFSIKKKNLLPGCES